MATITALNVRLGMDASNFSAGADLARNEVNKVSAIMRQSEPPAKKFQREIELLDKAFSEAGKQTKEYADAVEFLRKKHGQIPPEIKKTTSAVDQLKQSMMNAVPGGNMLVNALKGPAGAALALGAALAVISREVMKAAQRIDETAKAARGLGVAYRDLIAIQMLAGEVGGIDAATLNRGMGQFVRRLAEARVNGGALAETLKALGLDVNRLAAMNPAEAFAQVGDKIAAIPDHAERVRVAVALFGKEGMRFVEVLAQGSAGLDKMRAESERLGTAISDEAAAAVESMNDAIARSGESIKGIWNSLTTALAPTLTNVAKLAEEFFVHIRRSGEESNKLMPVFTAIAAVVDTLVMGFRGIVAFISDSMSLFGSLPAMLGGGELNNNFAELKRLLDEMDAASNGTAAGTKAAAEAAEAMAIEAERAAEAAARQTEQYEDRIRQLQIESVALAGNTELAREMQLAAEGYTREQIATLTAMEQQNQAMRERAEAEKKAAEEAAKRAADLAKQQERAAEDRKKEIERLKKASDDAFNKEVANSLAAAKKHFELEAQKAKQRRDEAAKGPGAGMEVGSAEAAKFMADTINRQMADRMPGPAEPTEKELLEEARKQFVESQKQTALQAKQEKALADMTVAIRENGFRRL